MPSYKPIEAVTFTTMYKLVKELSKVADIQMLPPISSAQVAELRNIVLTAFYDLTNATHLLFTDHDMGYPPGLVLDMLKFDMPVVGGICPGRVVPLRWVGVFRKPAETRGDFLKMNGIGMGVTLIRRDAVDTLLNANPALSDSRLAHHPSIDTLQKLGIRRLIRAFDNVDVPDYGIIFEDIAFCYRYRQAGGEIWGNMKYRISHVGTHDFGPYSFQEHGSLSPLRIHDDNESNDTRTKLAM